MTTTQKLIEGQDTLELIKRLKSDFIKNPYKPRGNEVWDLFKQALAVILEAEIERKKGMMKVLPIVSECRRMGRNTYLQNSGYNKALSEEITHLQSLLALLK